MHRDGRQFLFPENHRNKQRTNLAYTLWSAVRRPVNIDGMTRAYFDSMRQRIGSRIREKRTGNSWTQEDLAETAKMSIPYLSGIEGGKCNPSLRALCRICVALQVELNGLDKA